MNELVEIARIISDGDPEVIDEVSACAEAPAVWFSEHEERYMDRMVRFEDGPDVVKWIGMVDILEEHNYVCERDWKDEKADFVYFLSGLEGTKRLGLEIDPDQLDENGGIEEWCGILNENWEDRQCCAAAVGIDSDSFVLFPCTLEQLERLGQLAAVTNYSIEKV